MPRDQMSVGKLYGLHASSSLDSGLHSSLISFRTLRNSHVRSSLFPLRNFYEHSSLLSAGTLRNSHVHSSRSDRSFTKLCGSMNPIGFLWLEEVLTHGSLLNNLSSWRTRSLGLGLQCYYVFPLRKACWLFSFSAVYMYVHVLLLWDIQCCLPSTTSWILVRYLQPPKQILRSVVTYPNSPLDCSKNQQSFYHTTFKIHVYQIPSHHHPK